MKNNYDGLKNYPEQKTKITELAISILNVVNRDTGHLADSAVLLEMYANELHKIGSNLHDEFKENLANTKQA